MTRKMLRYPVVAVAMAALFAVATDTQQVYAHKEKHTADQLKAFHDAFMEQVKAGDNLFHGDPDTEKRLGVKLSNTGMACAMCHPYTSDTHPGEARQQVIAQPDEQCGEGAEYNAVHVHRAQAAEGEVLRSAEVVGKVEQAGDGHADAGGEHQPEQSPVEPFEDEFLVDQRIEFRKCAFGWTRTSHFAPPVAIVFSACFSATRRSCRRCLAGHAGRRRSALALSPRAGQVTPPRPMAVSACPGRASNCGSTSRCRSPAPSWRPRPGRSSRLRSVSRCTS